MSIAPQYTYRQLTSDDVMLLKQLLRIFGDAFNDSETYQHAIPSDEYLTNLLGKEHFMVIVAMMGKAVVGGLAAYVLEKFEQQRREIYIYDLAVSDAHRRKGVATGTINALRKIAAGKGAYVIFVQADLEDSAAIALYRSFGTMKPAHHFDNRSWHDKVRGKLIESRIRLGSGTALNAPSRFVQFSLRIRHRRAASSLLFRRA